MGKPRKTFREKTAEDKNLPFVKYLKMMLLILSILITYPISPLQSKLIDWFLLDGEIQAWVETHFAF